MKSLELAKRCLFAGVAISALATSPASAQNWSYEEPEAEAADAGPVVRPRTEITPYIEANQILAYDTLFT